MSQVPSVSDPSLTDGMDSPQQSRQPSTSSTVLDPEPDQSLPSLREVVGPEYHAERPLLPQPGPTPAIPQLFIPGVSAVYLDPPPTGTYHIGGIKHNMVQPPNETKSEFSRFTIDGRRITYSLEVVQQPEKARACGSGPRSSADRRPVDPPPVVELRVFSNETDVTMIYDATFMLYASLEVARPIASGKMHTPPAIPVLTGVAVASAAYLDRPERAAYFIFPDLSVRHEGWYRLKFSLFEGVKHEMDADHGKPFTVPPPSSEKFTPPVRHESMSNRLEVQSVPFQVYSAKKFPGLNTSTALSKLVADQGCRVRIRRDIRQRKRAKKAGADADDDHNSSYHGTPQATYRALEHSRSASRNSLGSQYEAETARRASIESIYGRPAIPSRQSSIASMPLASPSLPSLTPTSSMPPPPAFNPPPPPAPRHILDSPVGPAPTMRAPPAPASRSYQSTTPTPTPSGTQPPHMRPITPDNDNNLILPPLHFPISTSNVSYDQNTRQWNLPESSSTKRSYSPQTYDHGAALKAGARPMAPVLAPTPPARHYPPSGANDYIEPDTRTREIREEEDDDLMDGELVYTRADGTKGNKIARILNPYVR
ncbi:uncharacterized protein Z518_00211 [Rhinocladiella mackenziei CBS 650.93]|uniref:Velvet domain-containing protein n=1 Tax=Rhinocladiella mackenziei CBS 650.93 TaxID=1442369 RepID=A0A0D2HER4_9EURO|nr:uncharacterized protein Z518_00211 [Rhinocladiella mackenziei CBS 650.93]KIX09133.1 hypothetical protein Z518_00211 [Rhinocladiella mackenziei CBS 650.93]